MDIPALAVLSTLVLALFFFAFALFLLFGLLEQLGGHDGESIEPAGIEFALLNRCPYGAPRLNAVRAIVEPAAVGQVDDVAKDPLERIFGIPKPNGPDTRGVDQQGS